MERKSSLQVSLLGIIGILFILLTGTLFLKIDTVLLLILSIIYIGAVACFDGWKVDDIIEGMKDGCSQAFVGLLFFLLIGAVIGIWIQSGTVPSLVYYGLDMLNPKYFLVSSFIICCLVSSILGTSWGTVGTIGVAIMGMAISSGIEIPAGIIAGSIVSGAWFGDKMSPISDTNVLVATTSKTDVYKHIKAMMYTTIPSFIISIIIFYFINKFYTSGAEINYDQISLIKESLNKEFYIGPLAFIPIILLVILCVFKVNAVISLLLAIGIAIICSVFLQGDSLLVALNSVINGVNINTGILEVDTLLNRGGINSMQYTFLLGFMALCLGGVLQKTGYLNNIVESICSNINKAFPIVFMTMSTCILGTAVFADTYLSIVLNANMYRDLYDKRGLDSSMLSRVISESATMSTPLIPWTAASAFIVGALGVPTTEYALFAVLNIINPLISLILTFLGYLIIRKEN